MSTNMQKPKTVCSVNEAAKIVGVCARRIRQLIESGEIRGFRLTPRMWLVDRQSAAKAAKTKRLIGRPRKS